ncbi:MAG TPA: DUF1543 domain-containing protein [Mycobacteriales bacterium]|jgi:hypothetical protein
MDLFVVYLGGRLSPGRIGEDHEVVLVVAEDEADARAKAKAKWGGAARAHVDAVSRVGVVDGHRVSVTHTGEPDDVRTDDTHYN